MMDVEEWLVRWASDNLHEGYTDTQAVDGTGRNGLSISRGGGWNFASFLGRSGG
jgi:hypothetical protein